jgi:hypothetical protein
VEVDQLLGRGAHIVRCHGASLLTKGLTNDESADSGGVLKLLNGRESQPFLE